MHVPNLLSGWSTASVVNSFSREQPLRPYKVWILSESEKCNGVPKPYGICAKSLEDLKRKAWENTDRYKQGKTVETINLFVTQINDGTAIMDDEYLKQIADDEDLMLLLPGQEWKFNEQTIAIVENHQATLISERNDGRIMVRRKCKNESKIDNNYRYFVPTPHGEMARLTFDIFRESPDEAGTLRLHAATAGESGMTVSYELRLKGVKQVVQYAVKWTAVVLTYVGKLMFETGEFLKRKTC